MVRGHVPYGVRRQMAGHGGTVSRRTGNNQLTTVLTITKALTKTTNCTFRAKKVEGHNQQFFPDTLRRISAPPPTFSNSFWRHWADLPLYTSSSVVDDQRHK